MPSAKTPTMDRRTGLGCEVSFKPRSSPPVSVAHPRGIRKVRNCRSELPSQNNDLEFRTKFTKSGALERMGRRETKTTVWRVGEVGSFQRKAHKHWAFHAPRLGPETVVAGGNGGGLETRIQRSPLYSDWRRLVLGPIHRSIFCRAGRSTTRRATTDSSYNWMSGQHITCGTCRRM